MSWRSIQQSVFKPSVTWIGAKRKVFRFLKYLFFIGILSLTIFLGFAFKKGYDVLPLLNFSREDAIKIDVKTDGVLDLKSISKQLKEYAYGQFLSLDIQSMKVHLESIDQIQSISITKDFPATLIVSLKEHLPIAKLAIKQHNTIKVLLVSQEGAVYTPLNYSKNQIKQLPWLDGVKLVKSHSKYLPLQIGPLSRLLMLAKEKKPHLYEQFQVIQCQGIDSNDKALWSSITIKSPLWGLITFSTYNYEKELDRLDSILMELKAKKIYQTRSIDLAFTNQAVVKTL